MKIRIDVDLTPAEARAFFGLADLKPMQDALMADVEERMKEALANMSPEALVKTWMPVGIEGFEQLRKTFWSNLAGDAGEKE